MMAQESVLAKLFQEDSASDNLYLQQAWVHSVTPLMEQVISVSLTDEDEDDDGHSGDEDSDSKDSSDDYCEDKIASELALQSFQYVHQQSQCINAVRMGLTQAKLLKECEIMIGRELFNSGIKQVEKLVLEREKFKLLGQRIKSGDKGALLYVRYYGQFMCESLCLGTPVDYEEYVQLLEEIKHSLLEAIEMISQNQHNLAALTNFSQKVGGYYLEEVCTTLPTDAVFSYDPLFSLPKGVQPSAVLKVRIQRWAVQNITQSITKKNDFFEIFATRLILTWPEPTNQKVMVTVEVPQNKPPVTGIIPPCFIAKESSRIVIFLSPESVPSISHQSMPQNTIIPPSAAIKALICDSSCLTRLMKTKESCLLPIESMNGKLCNPGCEESDCSMSVHANYPDLTNVCNLCLKCTSIISSIPGDHWLASSLHNFDAKSMDSIKSSLTSFAMGLLACSSIEADYIETSLMYIKHLSNNSLLQLSIPLLITVLEHSILTNTKKREIYLLLVEAVKQTMLQCNTVFLQNWFLEATCDYFLQLMSDKSDLPDLNTNLCSIFVHLLKTKADSLIRLAVENTANSLPAKYILGRLSAIQQMYNQSVTPDVVAAVNFLSGISEIYANPSASLDFLVTATWQNPKLCLESAKALAHLSSEFAHLKCIFRPKRIAVSKPYPLLGQTDHLLNQKEEAVDSQVSRGEKSHSQAALWYLDLMENPNLVCCNNKKVLCLLKAAIHFESELAEAKLVPEKLALKNAALTCISDACQLVTRLHPGMRVITFQIALEVTLRLGTADHTVFTKQCVDAVLAGEIVKNLAYNRQFTYLWYIPFEAIQVSCAHYLNQISYAAQEAYLQELKCLDESLLPLKSCLLHYQHFENALVYGHMCTAECKSSLLNKRNAVMHKLLDEKGLTFQDVSHRMNSPHVQRDSEGWLVPHRSLGQHLQIAQLKGFCLDFSDNLPAIKLIIEPAKHGNGLLSFQDVFDILTLDFNEIFPIRFSLDPPSTTERVHPFNDIRCHPSKLKNTDFMDTLFQADYLLKSFSTGTEVSSNPPFSLRSVQENLIKNLPKDLQYVLRPAHLRGCCEMAAHRMWIEADEILFNDEISEECICYYIQNVKLVVHSRPLVKGVNGHCYDAIHTEFGPHAEFAADFTENYDKISQHFPIFARVGELAKLQFMMQKLCHHLQLLKQTSTVKYEALHSELNRLKSHASLKESLNECTWVPAVYTLCGCRTFVYGGVVLRASHKLYYNLVGNDCPHSETQLSWVDVYNNLINPIKGLEIMPGGIYFGLQQHCRVPIYVSEPDRIVCVKLGTTTSLPEGGILASSASPRISCLEADLTSKRSSLSSDLNPINDGLVSQKSTPSDAMSPDMKSSHSESMDSTCANNFHSPLYQHSLENDQPIIGPSNQSGGGNNQQNAACITKSEGEQTIPADEGESHEGVPSSMPYSNDSENSAINLKKSLSSDTTVPKEDCNIDMPDQASRKPLDPNLKQQHEDKGELQGSEMRISHKEIGDTIAGSNSSIPPSPTALPPGEDVESTTPACHESVECLDLPNEDLVQNQGGLLSPIGTEFTSELLSGNESQVPEDQIKNCEVSSLQSDSGQRSEVSSQGGISSNVQKDVDVQKDVESISLNEEKPDLGNSLTSHLKISGDDTSQGLGMSGSSKGSTNMSVAPSFFVSDQDKSTPTAEKTYSQDLLSEQSLPSESVDSAQDSMSCNNSTATNHPKLLKLETSVPCVSANDSSASIGEGSHSTSALNSSFERSFLESPLNIAVFGKIMQDAGMNLSSSAPSANITDLHPSLLVREQVKNVIVLVRILDACSKQGITLHAASK